MQLGFPAVCGGEGGGGGGTRVRGSARIYWRLSLMPGGAAEIAGDAIEVIGKGLEFLVGGAIAGFAQLEQNFNRFLRQTFRAPPLIGCCRGRSRTQSRSRSTDSRLRRIGKNLFLKQVPRRAVGSQRHHFQDPDAARDAPPLFPLDVTAESTSQAPGHPFLGLLQGVAKLADRVRYSLRFFRYYFD